MADAKLKKQAQWEYIQNNEDLRELSLKHEADKRFQSEDGSLDPWLVPDAPAPYEQGKASESESTRINNNSHWQLIKDGEPTKVSIAGFDEEPSVQNFNTIADPLSLVHPRILGKENVPMTPKKEAVNDMSFSKVASARSTKFAIAHKNVAGRPSYVRPKLNLSKGKPYKLPAFYQASQRNRTASTILSASDARRMNTVSKVDEYLED